MLRKSTYHSLVLCYNAYDEKTATEYHSAVAITPAKLGEWITMSTAQQTVRLRFHPQTHFLLFQISMTSIDLTQIITEQELENARKKLFGHEARRKKPQKNIHHPPAGRGVRNKFHEENINTGEIYQQRCADFKFKPYTGTAIEKPSGGYRPLLVPHNEDRIILKAIFPHIRGIILRKHSHEAEMLGVGKKFSRKNIGNIVSDIAWMTCQDGYRYIMKIDFSSFFSTIDRKHLLSILREKYFNPNDLIELILLNLIKVSLYNEIQEEGGPGSFFLGDIASMNLKEVGIPQGLPYSPLLANIYTLGVDQAINSIDGCRVIRYIDDMIIVSKTKKCQHDAFNLLRQMAKRKGLRLNEEKTKTYNINSSKHSHINFLGINIRSDGTKTLPTEKKGKIRGWLQKINDSSHHLAKYTNHPHYKESEHYKSCSVQDIVKKKMRNSIDGVRRHYKSNCIQGVDEFIERVEKQYSL